MVENLSEAPLEVAEQVGRGRRAQLLHPGAMEVAAEQMGTGGQPRHGDCRVVRKVGEHRHAPAHRLPGPEGTNHFGGGAASPNSEENCTSPRFTAGIPPGPKFSFDFRIGTVKPEMPYH